MSGNQAISQSPNNDLRNMKIADDPKSTDIRYCPGCLSEENLSKLRIDGFYVKECLHCELIFTIPLPSDDFLNIFYQGFLYSDGFSSADLSTGDFDREVKARMEELASFPLNPRFHKKFLDFGGGNGAAFVAARKLGFESSYYDVDENSIERLSQKN